MEEILNLNGDDFISYIEAHICSSSDPSSPLDEDTFDPDFVREVLAGETAEEFKRLLLSQLLPSLSQPQSIEKSKGKQTKAKDDIPEALVSSSSGSRVLRPRKVKEVVVLEQPEAKKKRKRKQSSDADSCEDGPDFESSCSSVSDVDNEEDDKPVRSKKRKVKTPPKKSTVQKKRGKKKSKTKDVGEDDGGKSGGVGRWKTCLLCDLTFENLEERAAHEETHEKDRPFKCAQCWRRYSCSRYLRRHVIYIHENSRSTFRCPYDNCSKTAHRKDILKVHIQTFHEKIQRSSSTSHTCPAPKCQRVFRDLQAMRKHMEKVHPKFFPFPCPVPNCDSKFALEHLLALHRKRAHENYGRVDKLYCLDCDKLFSSSHQLRNHRRIHTKDFPYECTLCPRKFAVPWNLEYHLRVHSKEKPYKCSKKNCSYAAAQRSQLIYHNFNVHGEGRHKCTYENCQEVFAYRFLVEQHVRQIHDKSLRLKCDFPRCRSTFISKAQLNRHRKTEHEEGSNDGRDDSDDGEEQELNSNSDSDSNSSSERKFNPKHSPVHKVEEECCVEDSTPAKVKIEHDEEELFDVEYTTSVTHGDEEEDSKIDIKVEPHS